MSKYPQGALNEIDVSEVQEMVGSLKELYDLGKPTTDEEVEDRVNQYFSFCQKSSLRPGIEGLTLALHIGRTTLYNWSNGIKCSKYRQEIIQGAKAFINAYIEAALLGGKISPPSGIFLMKNWCGYKDAVAIEDSIPHDKGAIALSVNDLPKLSETASNNYELPELGEVMKDEP